MGEQMDMRERELAALRGKWGERHPGIESLEAAQLETVQAYLDGDYDLYEGLLDHFSRLFGFDRNLFEDCCTDVRILGLGRC